MEKKYNEAYEGLKLFQTYASSVGVHDVFADNAGKTLIVAHALNLTLLNTKNGNDIINSVGKEFELKCTTKLPHHKQFKGFSAGSRLSINTIENRFSKVRWCFAAFIGIELDKVWGMQSNQLTNYFTLWKQKLIDGEKLNNPKIPYKYVETNGLLLWTNNKNKLTNASPSAITSLVAQTASPCLIEESNE